FLTRSTRWLAIAFVVLSITLAAVAVETSGGDEISTTLDRTVAPAAPVDPLAPAVDPLAPASVAPPAGEASPAAPAADPLSGTGE
ncbi:MAG TPA: preprotein translocase subunit SecG, partial [Erythrobacter sp.]|nr:preprotein translocase subunit SecG [Erythrobacter sp.]